MTLRRWNDTDLGDPTDPKGLLALGERYYESLRVVNFAARTIENIERRLRALFAWCNERGIERPTEIDLTLLERYQEWLYRLPKEDGQPLDARTQAGYIAALKGYFRWLAKRGHIPFNPASEIAYPKVGERLPKAVLTHPEVEQILRLPDVATVIGLRDRAVMEVLYSTGIRAAELRNLGVHDLDRVRGTVMVRRGKGRKDRVVPIGARALGWIDRYVSEARPRLAVRDPNVPNLFLNYRGEPFSKGVSTIVSEYVRKANIGKAGACHGFRHGMATEMLENGADIRYIQQLLGHVMLTSTQIYTRVSIKKLKQVHTATHPAATQRKPSGTAAAPPLPPPFEEDDGR